MVLNTYIKNNSTYVIKSVGYDDERALAILAESLFGAEPAIIGRAFFPLTVCGTY